jgi:hypothetical protein
MLHRGYRGGEARLSEVGRAHPTSAKERVRAARNFRRTTTLVVTDEPHPAENLDPSEFLPIVCLKMQVALPSTMSDGAEPTVGRLDTTS